MSGYPAAPAPSALAGTPQRSADVRRRYLRAGVFLCTTILCVVIGACTERPTLSAPVVTNSSAALTSSASEAEAQLIARALALALANDDVRARLLEDLRDSPFPKHRLHLQSYLRGASGRALLLRAAAARGATPDEFLAALRTLPTLELWMPRSMDRTQWRGDANVAVFGTALTPAELMARSTGAGYMPDGRVVTVRLDGYDALPYLAIMATAQSFGTDPESVRQGAPRRSGATISTQPEEMAPMTVLPGDTTGGPLGGPGPNPGPGYLTLPSGRAAYECTSSFYFTADADVDGLDDACEYELAYAFRPRLKFNDGDPWSGREPYWSARTDGLGGVTIWYAMSYYFDGGFRGNPDFNHVGDSEFIIVNVAPHPSVSTGWRTVGTVLSAHYQAGAGDFTTWNSGTSMEYRDGEYLQRPIVYVSWGKHANYRTKSACNAGAWYYDDCADVADRGAEPAVLPNANLGQSWAYAGFINCVTSRDWPSVKPGTECYWSPQQPFYGWSWDHSSSAASYGVLLPYFGF